MEKKQWQQGRWQDFFPAWDLPKRVAPQLESVLGEGPRDAEELAFAQEVEALPKIELHVHLEAAVPSRWYEQRNRRLGLFAEGNLPTQRAPFGDFSQFIRAWLDHTRLITREDEIQELAEAFVELRSKQNIVYTEAHISPFDFTMGRRRLGLSPILEYQAVLRAYLRGIRQGLARFPGVEVRLIVDLLWISDASECEQMLQTLSEVVIDSTLSCPRSGRPLIVALGLGGYEAAERAAEKRSLLDRYSSLGLKLDIHSGETTTAAEHARACDILRPDRIGHGVAPGVRPAGGIDFFSAGIGVCASSNLLTGACVGSLVEHPLKAMLEKGVSVSINTDDPVLFGTTLTLEYVMLRRAFGIELPEVRTLLAGTVAMAFDQPAARRSLAVLFKPL